MLVNRDTPRELSQVKSGEGGGNIFLGGSGRNPGGESAQWRNWVRGKFAHFPVLSTYPPKNPRKPPKSPFLSKASNSCKSGFSAKLVPAVYFPSFLGVPDPPGGGFPGGDFGGVFGGGPGGPFLPFFRGEGKIREIAIYEHFPQTQNITVTKKVIIIKVYD